MTGHSLELSSDADEPCQYGYPGESENSVDVFGRASSLSVAETLRFLQDAVTIRTEPSVLGRTLGTISSGQVLPREEERTSSDGSGSWCRITHPVEGWVLVENEYGMNAERLREPPRALVLTLHLADQVDDGVMAISFTNAGGDEVAQVEADLMQPVSQLRCAVRTQLDGDWVEFMLPDGHILEAAKDCQKLSEALEIGVLSSRSFDDFGGFRPCLSPWLGATDGSRRKLSSRLSSESSERLVS